MRSLDRSSRALIAALTFSLVFSASHTVSAQTSCTAPPAGMVAWYPGDGNALDIQGGNNGTLQGNATFAPGKVAQAFNLDGAGDYVEAPDSNSLDLTTQLTIDAWINPNNVSPNGRIVDKITPATGDGYLLDLVAGKLRLIAGTVLVETTQTIPANTFTHVAATLDGTQVVLYINGVAVTTELASGGSPVNSLPLRIGDGRDGSAPFAGLIDEVEIFNRALSATEIQAIYNADAAGKCKAAQSAGSVIISEFRWDGPDGSRDEFIELYNTTNTDITVAARDGSSGWAVAADDATGTRFVIPAGTVIPARGHFLITNSNGYSLSSYPAGAGTTATPDGTYTADILENTGIALFNTATPANFDTATRLDAVGSAGGGNFCTGAFPASSALYREGVGLAVYGSSPAQFQYSLLRDLASGQPKDTGDNSSDFRLVETTANFTNCAQDLAVTLKGQLGAPGPENTTSPVQRNGTIKASLIDSMQPSFAAPNRVRSGAIDPAEPSSNTRGTLKIRRKFTNLTGQPVTRLRFRVVNITTAPRADASTADLRVLPGSSGSVTLSDGTTIVQLTNLTREEPPVQSAMGGGLNTTLSATLAQTLADNASINVEFNLGVVEDGNFRFFVNVEALTGPPTNPPAAAAKAGAQSKASRSKTLRAIQ